MKNITYKIMGLFFIAATIAACKKSLISYNKNPDVITSATPAQLFSDALVRTTTGDMEGRFNYCHAFMQYGYSSFWSGTAYVQSDGIAASYWNNFYVPVLTNLEYLIPTIKDQPQSVSTYAAARIWRAFIFEKLTDFYGDIPYSQVATSTYTPVYDHQQQIYADLIKELRESIALLAANSSQSVAGDQFYKGSAPQWKKLGASVLLRVGMRLIKIDPAQAASIAKEAVSDGVMTSNDDMPVLTHNQNLPNGIYTVVQDGVEHFFLHQTLVNQMKTSADPRLNVYGAVYDKEVVNGGVITDTNPNNYTGADFAGSNSPNVRIRADIFGLQNSPFFDFPYAEVEFLQAEAILRGYITGVVNDHYVAGVTASMQSLKLLPTNPDITPAQINNYLIKNPLTGSAEQQIERVNTEFWLAGFAFDADEVWANWRRTGYPVLVPNAGSVSKTIPRKMTYPINEFSLNGQNVNAALASYGGQNTFNPQARVWWDKQ